MGEIMIKNDLFIQSIHNDIQCIESLDEKDKGTCYITCAGGIEKLQG